MSRSTRLTSSLALTALTILAVGCGQQAPELGQATQAQFVGGFCTYADPNSWQDLTLPTGMFRASCRCNYGGASWEGIYHYTLEFEREIDATCNIPDPQPPTPNPTSPTGGGGGGSSSGGTPPGGTLVNVHGTCTYTYSDSGQLNASCQCDDGYTWKEEPVWDPGELQSHLDLECIPGQHHPVVQTVWPDPRFALSPDNYGFFCRSLPCGSSTFLFGWGWTYQEATAALSAQCVSSANTGSSCSLGGPSLCRAWGTDANPGQDFPLMPIIVDSGNPDSYSYTFSCPPSGGGGGGLPEQSY